MGPRPRFAQLELPKAKSSLRASFSSLDYTEPPVQCLPEKLGKDWWSVLVKVKLFGRHTDPTLSLKIECRSGD